MSMESPKRKMSPEVPALSQIPERRRRLSEINHDNRHQTLLDFTVWHNLPRDWTDDPISRRFLKMIAQCPEYLDEMPNCKPLMEKYLRETAMKALRARARTDEDSGDG